MIVAVLLWILLMVVMAARRDIISERLDVSPTESFALLRDVNRIIVQPNETFIVALNERFRGQQLRYDWNLEFINGTKVPEELAKSIINITDPYKILHSPEDINQRSNLRALP
jgi:hypothetical protein